MDTSYIPRLLSDPLRAASERFPALVVTGPRQSGKTTLVREQFGDTHSYLTLDDPLVRDLALEDPRLFLARHPAPLIIDEVQQAPELLRMLKLDIDEHRRDGGRYVLTGSQLFPLMQGVSESLAGRAAVFSLHSMSMAEIEQRAEAGSPDQVLADLPRSLLSPDRAQPMAVATRVLRGGYPEPALDPGFDLTTWHSSYVQTYLERDVRALRAVSDLRDFRRFLVALAARCGGLLNASELARDLGVSQPTVRAWISVLEASGQAAALSPWFRNLGRRLVKSPKVYLLDTGTLCYLLRIREPEQLLDGPYAGLVFETAVHAALVRLFTHRGEAPPLYHWRTADGHEVDFIVELGDRLVPVEAKLTATPKRRHASGILRLQQLIGDAARPGFVACLVDRPVPLHEHVWAIPIGAL
jgi:predicted AAA+ superfamily ATPase